MRLPASFRRSRVGALSATPAAERDAGAPAPAEMEEGRPAKRVTSGRRVAAGWVRDKRTWLALFALLVLLGIAAWQLAVQELGRQASLRESVLALAELHAAELGRQVRTSVASSLALGALARALGDNITLPIFDTVAASLIETHRGVTNLQLAPRGTVRMIYPLRDEDRLAIGHALLIDPARRDGAVGTIEAYPEQQATVAGPLRLVQGDMAIIARHPVFASHADPILQLDPYFVHPKTGENHTADCESLGGCEFEGPRDSEERRTYFWGFTTMLATVDTLLDPVHIGRLELPHSSLPGELSLAWSLRAATPHPSLNSSGGVFASSPIDVGADAVEAPISLPDVGIEWVLAVAPTTGWPTTSDSFIVDLALIGAFTVAGAGLLAALLLRAVRTAHARRAEELAAQASRHTEEERVAAATQARARLIRTVMHDLRSPLLACTSISRSLRGHTREGDAQGTSLLDALAKCIELMEKIMSDMLDFQRIESGHLNLQLAPFTPIELLDGVRATFGERAAEMGVELDVCDAPLPPSAWADAGTVPALVLLRGDSRRLQQCLNNGVSNALKFTKAGGHVRVTMKLTTADDRQPSPAATPASRAAAASSATHHDLVSDAERGDGAHASRTTAAKGSAGSFLRTVRRMSATAARRSLPPQANGASSKSDGSFVHAAEPAELVELEIGVVDDGIGLDAAELAALNADEAFTQVGRGQLQGNGGTGLGLNIVRHILRRHMGSELCLHSGGRGCGTSFVMRVRCEMVDSSEADTPPPSPAPRTSRGSASGVTPARRSVKLRKRQISSGEAPIRQVYPGYRVLHVEDDAFLRMTLPSSTLDVIGASYEQAEDGRQACDLVRSGQHFDCVLIDNQMPEMDGTEATAQLRAMGFAGLIIGMTGDPVGCDERELFEKSGLDACVDKDTDGVRRAVVMMLEHSDDVGRPRTAAAFAAGEVVSVS